MTTIYLQNSFQTEVQVDSVTVAQLMQAFPFFNQRAVLLTMDQLRNVYGDYFIDRCILHVQRASLVTRRDETLKAFKRGEPVDSNDDTLILFEELTEAKKDLQGTRKSLVDTIEAIRAETDHVFDQEVVSTKQALEALIAEWRDRNGTFEEQRDLLQESTDPQDMQALQTLFDQFNEYKDWYNQQRVSFEGKIKLLRQHHDAVFEQRSGHLQEQLASTTIDIHRKALEEYELGFISLPLLLSRLMKSHKKVFAAQFEKSFLSYKKDPGKLYSQAVRLYTNLMRRVFDDILLLACPAELILDKDSLDEVIDVLTEYTSEVAVKMSHVLAGLHSDDLLGEISERSMESLFYEFLCTLIFPGYHLQLRIGLGGTEDPINVRLCSYPVLALKILDLFRKHGSGNMPTLHIINGYHLAVTCNGMSEELAAAHAEATVDLMMAVVHKFFPELVRYVIFVSPQTSALCENERYQKDVFTLQEIFGDNVEVPVLGGETKKQYTFRVQRTKKAFQALKERAARHGAALGQEHSIDYICAHPQPNLFGNFFPVGQAIHCPDGVIKLGGKGEQSFDLFQVLLVSCAQGDKQYYFTNTVNSRQEPRLACVTLAVGGDPPPYYSAGKAEIEVSVDGLSAFDSAASLQAHYQESFSGQHTHTALDVTLMVAEHGDDFLTFLHEYIGLTNTVEA